MNTHCCEMVLPPLNDRPMQSFIVWELGSNFFFFFLLHGFVVASQAKAAFFTLILRFAL